MQRKILIGMRVKEMERTGEGVRNRRNAERSEEKLVSISPGGE